MRRFTFRTTEGLKCNKYVTEWLEQNETTYSWMKGLSVDCLCLWNSRIAWRGPTPTWPTAPNLTCRTGPSPGWRSAWDRRRDRYSSPPATRSPIQGCPYCRGSASCRCRCRSRWTQSDLQRSSGRNQFTPSCNKLISARGCFGIFCRFYSVSYLSWMHNNYLFTWYISLDINQWIRLEKDLNQAV